LSQLSAAFIGGLRYFSSFDAIIAANAFVPVPPRTRTLVTTLAGQGSGVAEGSSKPISKLEITGGVLEPRKASAIIVVTDELARASHAAASELFAKELSGAVASSTDAIWLAELVATDSSPQTSGGEDPADALADLSGAMARIAGSAQSRYFAMVASDTAKRWAFFEGHAFRNMTPSGGSLAGVPILVTDGLPAGTKLALVDASQVAVDAGKVTLDASRNSTLVLDDESTAGPGALTSLWEKNLKAIRAERVFGFEILRAAAVAVVESGSE
jgi:hypothetical protein